MKMITNLIQTVKTKIHNVTRPAEKAPETVGEILADFEKKIQHLFNVNKVHVEKVANNTRAIQELNALNSKYTVEAQRAQNVAAKLKDLVS